MTDRLTITLAQLNPVVGDIDGNVERIRAARGEAAAAGADLVVFSELVVSGYPPEDLVLKPFFQDKVEAAVKELAADTADGGPALLVTAPWRQDGMLYNAALLLDGGKVVTSRLKHDLPNYGVFDEKRVFEAGPMPGPVEFRGVRLGVPICEDIWEPDVPECLEESGAEILLVPNGSPFDTEKIDQRLQLALARVTETGLPLAYINQVGGQDELVFDGASFVLNPDHTLAVQLPDWQEAIVSTNWVRGDDDVWRCEEGERAAPSEGLESIYRAMVLGLRDYVRKNGFPGALIGLSGGIDSALTAAVAVDALGAERVHCVMMPSPYTSDESLEDATEAAKLLGVKLDSVSIEPAMAAFGGMLDPIFEDADADTTEENIQARSRGLLLMAISNKLGYMVVTTGNKSEMSVGYATLYGDMCGGYSVLKDVYKTTVFALSHWRNQEHREGLLGPAGRVIPERIITKPPSAELKPDQTDQDTLPEYEELDDILECLIEDEMGLEEIIARGHDAETVGRVWRMLDIAEYKRRQAPPGVKITGRAFGKERRYPITNTFRRIV
ncbi:MAG: NAD+ synthase [Alphaproteobacteria bacterium]|jgi:NAD+ synthase|nr:NAD+ synthase [Alphaproteobacteria bacterium]